MLLSSSLLSRAAKELMGCAACTPIRGALGPALLALCQTPSRPPYGGCIACWLSSHLCVVVKIINSSVISTLFGHLAEVKATMHVQEASVTQCTLEQIFLMMASKSRASDSS